MTIRTTLFAVLAAGAAVSLPALAQDIKPGLWEQTNDASYSDGKVQANMSDIQKMLGSLSPEQRQRVQQMAQQNGVQMDLSKGALQSRMCLTQEMIDRRQLPMQQGDCNSKLTPAGTNQMQVAFSCTRPRASGEGMLTVDSPTAYHASMQMHNQDQPNQVVNMNVAGRWVASDCGDLRPAPGAQSATAKRKK